MQPTKYGVDITYSTEDWAWYEVEALNEDEAEKKAIELLQKEVKEFLILDTTVEVRT